MFAHGHDVRERTIAGRVGPSEHVDLVVTIGEYESAAFDLIVLRGVAQQIGAILVTAVEIRTRPECACSLKRRRQREFKRGR